MVLSDLGIQSMVQYRTTHGSGRFRNRRELCAYEHALHCARQTFTDADLEETANNALQQLRKAALPSDHRWRFSAHRFWEQTVFRAARGLERSAQYRTAATIYRHALELPLRNHKDFAHRLALCLSRCDNPVEGIRICLEYADGQSNSYRLIRTGRRLARKACMEWTGHAVPPKPAASKVTLPYPLQGSKWITETGPQKIESAVIAHLRTHNRTAHHCENGLWTTLFGLLFADALFAPIPGMLPSPFLRAPLDLGTPEFQLRRQRTVDTILSAIEQGTAVKTLLRTIHQRYGQNIAGVSWYTHTPEFLCAVVDQVKPSALLFIMKQLLTEWSAAAKGLPDLVVLADDQDDPGTTHLPKELFLVEIKGPTDSLRDKQHWWITNLIASGVHTELWHVCPASG